MTQQQLYPYSPSSGGREWCNFALCSSHAFWWDTLHQAFWCDFHAMAVQGGALYSMCGGCFEWYPSANLIEGVCPNCRSVMPLLWSDESR